MLALYLVSPTTTQADCENSPTTLITKVAVLWLKKGTPAHSVDCLQRYALNFMGYAFLVKYVKIASFEYAVMVSQFISKTTTRTRRLRPKYYQLSSKVFNKHLNATRF